MDPGDASASEKGKTQRVNADQVSTAVVAKHPNQVKGAVTRTHQWSACVALNKLCLSEA